MGDAHEHQANILGPNNVALLIASLLQGLLFAQYGEYVAMFPGERRVIRWLVHVTMVLTTAKLVYILVLDWDKSVQHFGDLAYASRLTPLTSVIFLVSAFPSAPCQAFYIYRLWAFNRNLIFLAISSTMILLALASCTVLTLANVQVAHHYTSYTHMIAPSARVLTSTLVATGLLITVFTCHLLFKMKGGGPRSGSRDRIVFKLIRCCVESAAVPTLCSVTSLILANSKGAGLWYYVPNLLLYHCYAASLLYSLNSRRLITEVSEPTTFGWTYSAPNGRHSRRFSVNPSVHPLSVIPRHSVNLNTPQEESPDRRLKFSLPFEKSTPDESSQSSALPDLESNTQPSIPDPPGEQRETFSPSVR